MPRTANSASRSSSAPVRSGTTAVTVVLSAPVGSGSGPGRSTSTKRVTAPGGAATGGGGLGGGGEGGAEPVALGRDGGAHGRVVLPLGHPPRGVRRGAGG